MKILGIDPGLAITGYGLIDAAHNGGISIIEAGVIRASHTLPITERLKRVHDGLAALIEEHHPEVLVLEKLYSHYKHPTTSILMGHSRGVVCLLCGLKNIKLVSYPATRIKKAITGKGQASKSQIQNMITETLKLKNPPEPVDVTDALALAVGFVYIELKEESMRGMGNDIKNKR